MWEHHRLAWGPLAVHLALVGVGVGLGLAWVPQAPAWGALQNPAIAQAPTWMQPLLQWDAHWYAQIATEGYGPKSAAFFPLLPVLAALLAEATGWPAAAAGWALGNACGCLALLAAPAALARYIPLQAARRATWVLALLPTSFYLNTFYTEPLFLLATLAALYYAPIGRVWPTALAVWAATLTRNTGLALGLLVAHAVWAAYRSQGATLARVAGWGAALVLPVLGLGLFMLFLQAAFYDPWAFVTAQADFARMPCLPGQGLWLAAKQLAGWHFVPTAGRAFLFIGFGMQVLALAAWAACARQSLRLPAWRMPVMVSAVWLLVPLLSYIPSDPLTSVSRYVLVNAPLLLAVGVLPRRLFIGLCLACGAGLSAAVALFVRHWWVA